MKEVKNWNLKFNIVNVVISAVSFIAAIILIIANKKKPNKAKKFATVALFGTSVVTLGVELEKNFRPEEIEDDEEPELAPEEV